LILVEGEREWSLACPFVRRGLVLFGGRKRGSKSRSIFGNGREELGGVNICSLLEPAVKLERGTYNSEDFLKNGMAEACGMSDINIKPADKRSDD
jgi:hypothetical protein